MDNEFYAFSSALTIIFLIICLAIPTVYFRLLLFRVNGLSVALSKRLSPLQKMKQLRLNLLYKTAVTKKKSIFPEYLIHDRSHIESSPSIKLERFSKLSTHNEKSRFIKTLL